MTCETYLLGDAWLRRVDPRVRLVSAWVFAFMVALSPRPIGALGGLLVALGVAAWADLPWGPLWRRLRSLNLLMLTLAVLLPFSYGDAPAGSLGPFSWSLGGLVLAGTIALKANAIFLVVTALVSTIEPVHLGHALHRLGAPNKLVQILVFALRYMDLLDHERRKLVAAMRVRCFRPHVNRHTFHTYGYALGMLLVCSFDRSERVWAAMRCRGFQGHFHILDAFCLGKRDGVFVLGGMLMLAGLGWLAWH